MRVVVALCAGALLAACTVSTAEERGKYARYTATGGEWSQVRGHPNTRALLDQLQAESGGDGGTQ